MLNQDHALWQFFGLNPTGDLGPFTFYTSRRKGVVFFIKAPPLEPPSQRQLHQRNRFRMAAQAWREQTPAKRADWNAAAIGAGLKMTGFNLFVYFELTKDSDTINTIERYSHIQLL